MGKPDNLSSVPEVYVKTLTVVVCTSVKTALLGQNRKLKGQLARSTHQETGRKPSSTGCEETTDSRKLSPDLPMCTVTMHLCVHVHVCTHAHMHAYTEEEQGYKHSSISLPQAGGYKVTICLTLPPQHLSHRDGVYIQTIMQNRPILP